MPLHHNEQSQLHQPKQQANTAILPSHPLACAAPVFTTSYIHFLDLHGSGYGAIVYSQHYNPCQKLGLVSVQVDNARRPDDFIRIPASPPKTKKLTSASQYVHRPPQLNYIWIVFFNQLDCDVPRTVRFRVVQASDQFID